MCAYKKCVHTKRISCNMLHMIDNCFTGCTPHFKRIILKLFWVEFVCQLATICCLSRSTCMKYVDFYYDILKQFRFSFPLIFIEMSKFRSTKYKLRFNSSVFPQSLKKKNTVLVTKDAGL